MEATEKRQILDEIIFPAAAYIISAEDNIESLLAISIQQRYVKASTIIRKTGGRVGYFCRVKINKKYWYVAILSNKPPTASNTDPFGLYGLAETIRTADGSNNERYAAIDRKARTVRSIIHDSQKNAFIGKNLEDIERAILLCLPAECSGERTKENYENYAKVFDEIKEHLKVKRN